MIRRHLVKHQPRFIDWLYTLPVSTKFKLSTSHLQFNLTEHKLAVTSLPPFARLYLWFLCLFFVLHLCLDRNWQWPPSTGCCDTEILATLNDINKSFWMRANWNFQWHSECVPNVQENIDLSVTQQSITSDNNTKGSKWTLACVALNDSNWIWCNKNVTTIHLVVSPLAPFASPGIVLLSIGQFVWLLQYQQTHHIDRSQSLTFTFTVLHLFVANPLKQRTSTTLLSNLSCHHATMPLLTKSKYIYFIQVANCGQKKNIVHVRAIPNGHSTASILESHCLVGHCEIRKAHQFVQSDCLIFECASIEVRHVAFLFVCSCGLFEQAHIIIRHIKLH